VSTGAAPSITSSAPSSPASRRRRSSVSIAMTLADPSSRISWSAM
jgi:hypothetical protein